MVTVDILLLKIAPYTFPITPEDLYQKLLMRTLMMKNKSGTSKPASKKAAPKMNMGGAVKKKPIGYGKGGMIYEKAK